VVSVDNRLDESNGGIATSLVFGKVELVLNSSKRISLATIGTKMCIALFATRLFGLDGGGVKGGRGEVLVVAAAEERHCDFKEGE
jgi:hypothetical protein